MKYLFIPDVHQTKHWKKAMDKKYKDYIKIFFGDYFDEWDSEKTWLTSKPIENFEEIVAFKDFDPDKVVLLIGNHDLSYLSTQHDQQSVSGHQWVHHAEICSALRKALPKMLIAYKLDNNAVCSHAGFSRVWADLTFQGVKDEDLIDTANKTLQDLLDKNSQVSLKPEYYFSWCGMYSGSGDEPTQGPLWIRPNSLLQNALYDDQIVGHTEVSDDPPIRYVYEGKRVTLIDSQTHEKLIEYDSDIEYEFEKVKAKKRD